MTAIVQPAETAKSQTGWISLWKEQGDGCTQAFYSRWDGENRGCSKSPYKRNALQQRSISESFGLLVDSDKLNA